MLGLPLWKDIKGFPGYMVSNDGRILGMSGKILKQDVLKSGYRSVILCNKQGHFTKYVHRLVAEYFVPRASEKCTQTNHKDYNRANNKASNLEWVTPGDNICYSQARPVEQYDLTGNLLAVHRSTRDAARSIGVGHHRKIYRCALGYRDSAFGYKWKYANAGNKRVKIRATPNRGGEYAPKESQDP